MCGCSSGNAELGLAFPTHQRVNRQVFGFAMCLHLQAFDKQALQHEAHLAVGGGTGGARFDIETFVEFDPVRTLDLVVLQVERPLHRIAQRDVAHAEVAGGRIHVSWNIAWRASAGGAFERCHFENGKSRHINGLRPQAWRKERERSKGRHHVALHF